MNTLKPFYSACQAIPARGHCDLKGCPTAPARTALEAARSALRAAGDFIEDEADNRSNAGSEMSDYEREPRQLLERIDAAIATIAKALGDA